MSGKDWGRNFLKRHTKLKMRFAENVKYHRAKVSPESIQSYFNELKVSRLWNQSVSLIIAIEGRENSSSRVRTEAKI